MSTYPLTIPGLYHRQADRYGDRVMFYAKEPSTGGWTAHTWRQGLDECRAAVSGLVACGVKPGDRVGVLSETRREWTGADMAIVCAGAITVGVYPTSTPEQTAYVLRHAEARVCFAEDDDQLAKLEAIRDEVPTLERIILFEEGETIARADVLSLQELLDIGRARAADQPDEYERLWRAVQPEDLAMLVYTSGTTGPPKGVMLSHHNIYATIEAISSILPSRDDDLGVIFLPLAHSLQRVAGYAGMYQGTTGVFAERIDKIVDHMQEFHPTIQAAVPRIYEKVYARILGRVAEQPPRRQTIFKWAVDVGKQVAALKRQGKEVPIHLRAQFKAADKLVLRKIREVFGGRIRYMVSGAAPIGVELLEFFHACGILILEGYGLTETSAPATVNVTHDFRFGTVGKDLPICETKIADDGEILIKGDNVFSGYYKDPEATAEAFTEDGWFKSGDIGEKDADGFLKITDRKKELIITAAGKNVSPANIENLVKGDPLISHCVVHGDRRKFLVALISLDEEELPAIAKRLNVPLGDGVTQHPRILGEVQLVLDRVNRHLARYETIKYFRILDRDLTVAEDHLTPTLKLKRRNISATWGHLVDEMYAGARTPGKRAGDMGI
ncbi:MAG: long-chain acyl-CoA synthetase [Myxococcota bacterium]|jgi:long-chain acyl-CoA synthetase